MSIVRSILDELIESSIWSYQDSRQFVKQLFRVCLEFILYERTNLDRRCFDVYEFSGFFYKNLKENVQNDFLKKIRDFIPRILEAYDNDCEHSLHLIFNDKNNITNTIEVYSFDFYKTYNVNQFIRPLTKDNFINITKSILMSIAQLHKIAEVLDADKILVSFSLVYKEGLPPLNTLHPTLGSFYLNNAQHFVCKTIDIGNFWTGFHEIEFSVNYEMVNFPRVMFGVMERVKDAQCQYLEPSPPLPDSPTSIVENELEENFSELIPLACSSEVWSKCFVNQMIRCFVDSILYQRTNVNRNDFEIIEFGDEKYAAIKNVPSNLNSNKINNLFLHVYKPILQDEIQEVQFIFCKASKPPDSLEIYKFAIKVLDDPHDKSVEEKEAILKENFCGVLKAIQSLTRPKLNFEEFITYFRLKFLENVPLPKYQQPYYEINAYHKDDDTNAIVYKTEVLGTISTGYHELTVTNRYDLLDVNEYLQTVLHEKYQATTIITTTVDCSISSEEFSDEEKPCSSTKNKKRKRNSVTENKKSEDAGEGSNFVNASDQPLDESSTLT